MSVIQIAHSKNGAAHAQTVQAPDWRRIKPEHFQTPEECAAAMSQIDDIIGAIDTQLRQACADFNEQGIRADSEWMIAAQHALKKFKITRQAVQDRKGALSRDLRRTQHVSGPNTWPQRFVDAARSILDADTFSRICAAMDKPPADNQPNAEPGPQVSDHSNI